MGELHRLLSALGVTGDHRGRGTWDESLKTTQDFAQPSPLRLPPESQGALVYLLKPLVLPGPLDEMIALGSPPLTL